jgi:hypothetical protein
MNAIEVSHLRRIFFSRANVRLAEVMPLLLGYLLFAVFEVEAKKRGTLEVF